MVIVGKYQYHMLVLNEKKRYLYNVCETFHTVLTYNIVKETKMSRKSQILKEIKSLVKEYKSLNETKYYPYQIDDKRGEKLYDKYNKAMGDDNWVKKMDLHKSDNYEQHIPLDQFLKKSGMSISQLKQLEDYTDESWDMFIDEDENMLKIYHD